MVIAIAKVFANKSWYIQPQKEVQVLSSPHTLSAEKILPGFSLNLESVW